MESELIQIMSQFGFPIALSIYLLITRDKTIASNTDAINKLTLVLEKYYFMKENKKED